jgi:hypothetical protein
VFLSDHPFHGPIHHLGYVVENLEASVERLVSELGAGPFFVLRDVAFEQLTSRVRRRPSTTTARSGSAAPCRSKSCS